MVFLTIDTAIGAFFPVSKLEYVVDSLLVVDIAIGAFAENYTGLVTDLQELHCLVARLGTLIEPDIRLAVTGEVILARTREILAIHLLVDAFAFLPSHQVIPTLPFLGKFDASLTADFQKDTDIGSIAEHRVEVAIFIAEEIRVR